jgi:hypothetical protein
MAETATSPDLAEQLKTATAFFSRVFAPAPFLKAQADLLAAIEPTFSGWLHRRQEAATDAQQSIARLSGVGNPFEALKTQQEWVSRAFLRLAADTAAYQSATEQLVDRARTWLPTQSDNLASKGAESTQGMEQAERSAQEDADSGKLQAAAAARMARPPMRVAEKAG